MAPELLHKDMDLFVQVLVTSHDRSLKRFFQIELKQVSLDFTFLSVRTTPLTASFVISIKTEPLV